MKTWERYNAYLLNGEWHVHTNYVDGTNNVAEYCKQAIKHSIPLLAFTEHVAKNLTYDFNDFLDEIDRARLEYNLVLLSGCEVKVLPDGSLNVSDDILKRVDYPIFAFHAFPQDSVLFLDCLKKTIAHPLLSAWAHPCSFLAKTNISLNLKTLKYIFKLMKQHSVLLEYNKKYDLLPVEWIKLANEINLPIVRGSDIHSINDISSPNFDLTNT